MTSEELIEILNKTRRTANIYLSSEEMKELIISLEILEILKRAYNYDYEFMIFLKKCNFINVITNDELLKIEGWLKS